MISLLRRFALTSCFTAFCICSYAQACKTTAVVIADKTALQQVIKIYPDKKLVDLRQQVSGLLLDIRYATANNFTKAVLYYNAIPCMRVKPARALQQVQAELKKKGLGLKVFDAYRPFGVTCRMWHLVKDKRYVANPMKGSYHNRGLAVDLTIVDLKTGKELDMGTGYDNFTDSAHQSFTMLPPQVLANRILLRSTMHKYGFRIFPTEWWHYNWPNTGDYYEVLDLNFDDLRAAL